LKDNLLSFGVLGALVFLSAAAVLPSRGRANFSEARLLQVEVDVYSGRPNPRWELSAQQAEEFSKMLRALPKRECDSALAQGLGYRGLKVTGSRLSQEGYTEIVISRGIVMMKEESRSQQFIDKDRALERWLLQTGKGKLEEKLYEYLSEETSK
jgi:hypothetical protein